MDDQRFLKACQLRDQGKLREAIGEFFAIAEDTRDEIDKAAVSVYVAAALKELGEYDRALAQLRVSRDHISSVREAGLTTDYRLPQLEVLLDFEDADIRRFAGSNEEALTGFEEMLSKYSQRLREPDFRDLYEMTQANRAFLLADLGRWKESLLILEAAENFKNFKEEIAFYLGHCYLSAHDHVKAEEKLVEALRLELPQNLEYRAHCELGMVYATLGNYVKAKSEFESCAQKASAEYIKQAQLWKRLQAVCRALGLKDEVERYASLEMPS